MYPAIAANDKAQHPLMTWYVCMYAFSWLARYHAVHWRWLLNKEESSQAALLENLIQEQSEAAFNLVGGVLNKTLRA